MNTQIVRSSRTIAVASLVWAGVLLLATPLSFAQSFRGSIRGTVTDAHSLVIPSARITARNLGTSETREVTSDSEGVYFFLELPTGEYEVAAIAPGFQEVRAPHVIVNVGEATVADLKLAKPTEKVEQVVVSENVPLLETASSTLSQVVDRRLVQELPLNGRDFGKLVALTPGVTVEGSGVAGSEKGFGQFNINGNRDRSNNYTLDGTDNNDPWFNNSAFNQTGISGAPATLLPLDAIQEFNLQSQFGAEYGRNSGSVINVITRSGVNKFHGSLYEYNRNSYFDARNYFNPVGTPQSHFTNNDFGGSLGGPMIKDRTFFFAAYEGQRERVGSDFALQVPSAAQVARAELVAAANLLSGAVNPALDKILKTFMPTSDTNSIPVSVSDKNDNRNFIVKVDHKINSVHSVAARYAFGQDDQVFPFGSVGGTGSGSRLGDFAQVSPTRVQVVSASWLSVFDGNHVNEARFGYSRFRNHFGSKDGNIDPKAAFGIDFGTGRTGLPEIDFGSVLDNFGATSFGIPRGRISQTYQILDNFTWTRGRHTVKFGGEYRRAVVDFSNDNFTRGNLTFNSIPPTSGDTGDPIVNTLVNYFLGTQGTSAGSQAGFAETGNTARNVRNNGLSFFGEDSIRLRPNFTLSLGLRWEYFGPVSETHNLLSNLFDPAGTLVMVGSSQLPHAYNRDLNNFGPRLGIAWNVRRNTVLRAAYGIYYDYIPLHLAQANDTISAGIGANPVGPDAVVPLDFNVAAYNGTTPGPVFTPHVGPPFQPSIFITDHDLRTPYVQSWNLNVQRQFGNSFSFETGYVGSKGTKLVRLYDLNQSRLTGTATNINYGEIDVLSSGTSSTYHAGHLTARFQNLRRFSGFSTYTYSKSIDGASDGINFNFETVALPQDSTNLKAEKGPSIFDTRHRWTSALNYQLPTFAALGERLGAGWQLNSVISIQSGRPIDIISGFGINGRQRPNVVPGQPFVLPNWNPSTGYLNPLAFADPAGNFGNLGRDRVFGPGFRNVDFSLTKATRLWESASLQFRAELFNVFNHPNFALPSGFITAGVDSTGHVKAPAVTGQGSVTQTPDVAQGNPGLGGGGPRVLQFGLRLQF